MTAEEDQEAILENTVYHRLCEKQTAKCQKDNDERYITHKSIRTLIYSLIVSSLVVAGSIGVFVFKSGAWVKDIEITAKSAKEATVEIKSDQIRILNRDNEINRKLENIGDMVARIK